MIKNTLAHLALAIIPKNLSSRLNGKLLSINWPKPISLAINKAFSQAFGIDVSEAEKNLDEYSSLQELFIRKLKPGLRPISANKNAVISPCDGVLCEAGVIENGQLLQVKGKFYPVAKLLGSEELASKFDGGYYATIYLSPKDYHRFHVPIDGKISDTIYIPGSLWPVNMWAVRNIDNLFAVNERIISIIKHESGLSLAHVAVGATNVGKISLSYCSIESNTKQKYVWLKHDQKDALKVKKGEDLGCFMFGSTIVLLFEPGLVGGFLKNISERVLMGDDLAYLNPR